MYRLWRMRTRVSGVGHLSRRRSARKVGGIPRQERRPFRTVSSLDFHHSARGHSVARFVLAATLKTLRNDSEVSELQERLEKIAVNTPRLWGRMSAGEMVCHVREAYLGAVEQRPWTPGAKAPLPRWVMKWFGLRGPVRWPQGVPTVRELELGQPGTVPGELAEDIAQAVHAMKRFRAEIAEPPHAIFGAMTRTDWLRWGYLHTDHHLRQFGL